MLVLARTTVPPFRGDRFLRLRRSFFAPFDGRRIVRYVADQMIPQSLVEARLVQKARQGRVGADDIVILVDAHPRHDRLVGAVARRLREELARLHVVLNESKSRIVALAKGDAFGFLGFEFRRVRALSGKWRAHYAPRLKKRTALLRRSKELFRRYQSQPVGRVIELINPILRGWVTYFAIGHSARRFGYVRDWVEKKVRRHLMRARKRQGFGWKRWSRRWLYDTLGLFRHYRVHRPRQLRLKALPA